MAYPCFRDHCDPAIPRIHVVVLIYPDRGARVAGVEPWVGEKSQYGDRLAVGWDLYSEVVRREESLFQNTWTSVATTILERNNAPSHVWSLERALTPIYRRRRTECPSGSRSTATSEPASGGVSNTSTSVLQLSPDGHFTCMRRKSSIET